MKTRTLKAVVSLVTVGALAVVGTGTASATGTAPANSIYSAEMGAPSLPEVSVMSEDQLLVVFKAIEEIPDSVLQSGDAAAQAWLKSRLGDSSPSGPGRVAAFGVVGCVSAIGLAIVTNFPAFKITKIRSALKAAGGATTFVRNFKRVYDAQRRANASFSAAVSQAVKEAASAAGPEAQQLLIELFNLGNVYSACFE